MKKISFLILIAGIIFITGCAKQTNRWVGFYYQEGRPTQGKAKCEIKEFDTQSICEQWGTEKRMFSSHSESAYYCGFGCRYDSSCQYTCDTTQETNPNTKQVLPVEQAKDIEGDLYYIKNIQTKNGKTSIEVDSIKWLSFADKTCSSPSEVKADIPQCNPNGFLIENSNKKTMIYQVSPSAIIQTINLASNPIENTSTELKDFLDSFIKQKEFFEINPFIIQIENNVVTGIQQEYIP